jgi:hypothetical protein
MSKGPGTIERRIADLFAATRDRALDVSEIARHAFGAKQQPTRAQRISATRAAHRLLRRVKEMEARADELYRQARENTKAKLGRDENREGYDQEWEALLNADPKARAASVLRAEIWRIGVWVRFVQSSIRGRPESESETWRAITLKRRLRFYPADIPADVWAVTIDRTGVHWFDTEITKITARNVMVRYRGTIARLDRDRLWHWWAWWRGVRFVSSRTGRIAAALEEQWRRKYGTAGAVPPAMQMPLEQARPLLGVHEDYTREDVIAAFRRKAKAAHPDVGGTAEMFRILVEARDRLLTALGTSAPKPEMPDYAPRGVRMVYRVGRSRQNQLGSGTRRLIGG